MDKDKIINALNAIQNGRDAGCFYDELEAAIGVLMETSEDLIMKIVQEIHDDCDDKN